MKVKSSETWAPALQSTKLPEKTKRPAEQRATGRPRRRKAGKADNRDKGDFMETQGSF